MKRRTISIAFLVLALILTLVLAFTLVVKPGQQAKTQNSLALSAPPFVGEAQAQDDSPEAFNIGAYLDQEAGISAYYKASPITLSSVRGLFRTIELDTADYILGSIAVPNYAEQYDIHVYVHKDGWILAYYLKSDPASKIIDIKAGTITTTKLKNIVGTVASAAGSPFTDVTYYDFRYPSATHMMFIFEDYSNGNDFTVLLPSSYGYFERSCAVSVVSGYNIYFTVDGAGINLVWPGDNSTYGTITTAQLIPDVTHTIVVSVNGVLVIIYRVP